VKRRRRSRREGCRHRAARGSAAGGEAGARQDARKVRNSATPAREARGIEYGFSVVGALVGIDEVVAAPAWRTALRSSEHSQCQLKLGQRQANRALQSPSIASGNLVAIVQQAQCHAALRSCQILRNGSRRLSQSPWIGLW
jgi:hypothetical protein